MDWNFARLEIDITMGCNYRCSHCIASSGPERMKETMTPENISRILYEFKKCGGGAGVSLSGGEPTLEMDILTAGIECCNSLDLPVTLKTNGWWVNSQDVDKYLERFKKLDLILLTFDIYHAEFNNWPSIKRAVDIASNEYGILTHVACVTRPMGKIEDIDRITQNDTDYFLYNTLGGTAFSGGRAQEIKDGWSPLPLLCPMTEGWRRGFPYFVVMPDNCISINCLNKDNHYYEYSGDWTNAVDSVIDDYLDNQRLYSAILKELSSQKHRFVDGCDVCNELLRLKQLKHNPSDIYKLTMGSISK